MKLHDDPQSLIAWLLGVIRAAVRLIHDLCCARPRLGPYTLVDKLGQGGMGSVYLARHAKLRRPAAVKVVSPDRVDRASTIRFEREVELTSLLTHPNTIALYDHGRTTEGVLYYAMEYVDGMSLEELVRSDGPQPPARVIHVLRQIAGALGEAHRIGVIHRDVKPANVLLCERDGVLDWVKVVDFGLAKQTSTSGDASVTQDDLVTGTPAYIAPETITAPAAVDARADVYGVGGVAYFMLTGEPRWRCAPTSCTLRPSLRRSGAARRSLRRWSAWCWRASRSDRKIDRAMRSRSSTSSPCSLAPIRGTSTRRLNDGRTAAPPDPVAWYRRRLRAKSR
jgi:serine/threonine protein kinase